MRIKLSELKKIIREAISDAPLKKVEKDLDSIRIKEEPKEKINKKFSKEDAEKAIEKLNIKDVDFDELLTGLNVELEHGTINSETNITNDDLILTAKIAIAHLREDPKYYTKLKKIEE
jgi:hypothetical protein